MKNQNKIYDIIDSCSDEFSELLLLSGLDAERDLVGCDFSYVDFGAYGGDVLNLSYCNLAHSKLDRVRTRLVIDGADLTGAILPEDFEIDQSKSEYSARRRKVDAIKTALLLVYRFNVSTTIPIRVADSIFGRDFVAVEFTSAAEQDKLLQDVIVEVSRSCIAASCEYMSSYIIIIVSNTTYMQGVDKMDADASVIFERECERACMIGYYRIHCDGLKSEVEEIPFAPEMSLSEAVANAAEYSPSRIIMLTSGISPITNRSYKKIIGRNRSERVTFVFMVTTAVFDHFRSRKYKSVCPTKYLQRDWHLKENDISVFKGRLRRMQELGVHVDRGCFYVVDQYIGRNQSILKNRFLSAIMKMSKNIDLRLGLYL